jgi:hypothetical protein
MAKKSTKSTSKSKPKAKGKTTASKPKAGAKSKKQPKSGTKRATSASRKGVSLDTIAAEIEKISVRLDNIEKDMRGLKGVVYPIS